MGYVSEAKEAYSTIQSWSELDPNTTAISDPGNQRFADQPIPAIADAWIYHDGAYWYVTTLGESFSELARRYTPDTNDSTSLAYLWWNEASDVERMELIAFGDEYFPGRVFGRHLTGSTDKVARANAKGGLMYLGPLPQGWHARAPSMAIAVANNLDVLPSPQEPSSAPDAPEGGSAATVVAVLALGAGAVYGLFRLLRTK